MFSKILVAFDDSKASAKALDQGIRYCMENPTAKLEIVHVYYLPVLILGEAVVNAPAYVDKNHYTQALTVIEKAELSVSALHNASVTLKQGDPGMTIVEYAEDIEADLIIVGTRALGSIKEFVLGSVSHYIIQHAKAPVLVVK